MATDPVLSDPLLTSAGSHVTPAARSLNLRLGARLFVAADAFVFLGVPVRLPLPALAQPARALAAAAHRSVARARHRHAGDGRRQRSRAGRRAARAARRAAAQLARRRRRKPRARARRARWCRAGRWSTRGSRRTTPGRSARSSSASRRRSSCTSSAPRYWLETIVVSSGAFHREREGVAEPSLLYEPSASAYGTFALFLAGVEIVAFVLIYLA